jgi:hypothetical protein
MAGLLPFILPRLPHLSIQLVCPVHRIALWNGDENVMKNIVSRNKSRRFNHTSLLLSATSTRTFFCFLFWWVVRFLPEVNTEGFVR